MEKINISLVGGQPMPVYVQVLDQQPDIVYLVHSQQTQDQAERLKKSIQKKLPHSYIDLRLLTVGLNDADRDIRAYAQAWCPKDSEVVVNLSGGTKPWSLLFYRYFSQPSDEQSNSPGDFRKLKISTMCLLMQLIRWNRLPTRNKHSRTSLQPLRPLLPTTRHLKNNYNYSIQITLQKYETTC